MKHLKFFFIFAVLLTIGTTAYGQDVTIRANNGACVAAVKNGGVNDTFFNVGGFATWQHEQLNMVLTVSDGTVLTPNEQLDNPANNLFMAEDSVHMQLAHGQVTNANVCYATVSLPKGYRFTGYEIKFSKPGNLDKGEYTTYDRQGRPNGTARCVFNQSTSESTFGETNKYFSTYLTQNTIYTDAEAKTLKREESLAQPMSNVLYFKFENPTNARSIIQLDEAKFYFTAEENFTPLTPAGNITTPVSAVEVEFPTSKVDFGTISMHEYNGANRISYNSADVTDIKAKLLLYEAESTTTGTDVDGISGQIVDFKTGTISSQDGYFKVGKGANSTEEQVYFIETPTYVTISDGHKVPIGYRITAASFDYKPATESKNATFYITYSTGSGWSSTTYYLNANGRFATDQVVWEIDSEGYIYTVSNGTNYYLYFNNGFAGTQAEKPAESERFGIDSNNNIYQLQYPTYFITYYEETSGWLFPTTTRYGMISNTTGQKATYQQISPAVEGTSFTLNIYDKTGANAKSYNVTTPGSQVLTGLNNDAVKFGVTGQGLISATLTMQALDPYLDQMAVVCQDREEPAIKLTQYFHASDFSVSGGEFDFYLPRDCAERGDHVDITFEDLQSQYFDDTYDTYNAATGPHYSRLNFVRSAHYDAFGTTTNVIYNNTSEAASAEPLERQKVSIVGSAPFKFNNAGDVEDLEEGENINIEEYAFSLANYADAPNNGTFNTMWFQVKAQTQTDTRYVFTTDETRYNIAPTTATQHRAYAFYTMKVNIHSSTYEPRIKFTKIYNQTLYGTGQTDAFYGAEISTTAPSSIGAGYAATDKVHERIAQCITNKKDDFGNEAPKSTKQILYIDFSNLDGVYQTTTDEHQSMEDYGATNAANCLIFVPQGAGATVPNVAEKTTGGYRATFNFVLTDKEPFYTPYDIQVPSARTMTYKRKITRDGYGKVQNATIILPFKIAVENGKHTNYDGTEFTLHELQDQDALENVGGKTYAYMPLLGDAITETKANYPYVVHLDENCTEDSISFVVTQPGAPIEATPTSMNEDDYTFTGKSGVGLGFDEGELEGDEYTLTSKGTFAGIEISRNKNVFYFAQNLFYHTSSLREDITSVKVAPFRAYYEATGGNRLSSIGIIFDEGIGDTPTGINDVTSRIDTGIMGGKGTITITSAIDNNVKIYNTSGMHFMNVDMQAGETKTVNVPAGIYVVNGVKIIVK